MIVAHRQEILDQISRTLNEVGVKHGVIQSGRPTSGQQAIVASVQTLARRIHEVRPPDFVIVDEAHHAVSSQYMAMFSAWSKTRFLGVTATPERLDGRGLGGIFREMVMGPSVSWLIQNRFLASPVYYAPERTVDMSGVKRIAGDYSKSEAQERVDTPVITGDAVEHYKSHLNGQRVVVFCISIQHAQHVAERFIEAGIPAASIDGKLHPTIRKNRVKDLSSGSVPVLTSCDLISEGFDLPAVSGAILLRPTQSLALHLQQIGRALRTAPGKSEAIILDHVGNCLRHGIAEQEREWDLEGRTARVKKSQPIETSQCKRCFAIFAGNQCPQCGVEKPSKPREVEAVEGTLKKLSPEELLARFHKRKQESSCRSLDDLIQLGNQRGYKPGWAQYRWKARQGRKATT